MGKEFKPVQVERPDPGLLLKRIQEEERLKSRGRLKIFLGAVAGVGKTFAMLMAAQKLKNSGEDVIVGCVETHGRSETEALMGGLEILPRKVVEYRGRQLDEFDIDGALQRRPSLILVDELAHTNAPGSRHLKRWQDVEELLENGIDVYSTINVQHIESLHDVVSQITGVQVHERVADTFLERANEIALIDLPPDELIARLREGKVYLPERAEVALENFFRKGNLIALREIALRFVAERVDNDMLRYRREHSISTTWPATERILVCVSNSPLSIRLVRAAKRMATGLKAHWIVAFVETPAYESLPESEKTRALKTLRLAEQLGADTVELTGTSVAAELIRFARSNNATKIIIGKPVKSPLLDFLRPSPVDEIVRLSGAIDVYVISGEETEPQVPPAKTPAAVNPWSYAGAASIVAGCTGVASIVSHTFELTNVVMLYMLGVVLVSSLYGRGPSVLASVLSVAAFDFFFVPPLFTFVVADTQYIFTFAVMLATALVISTLTGRIRLQAQSARLRERRTAALYSLSRELSSSLDSEDLIRVGLRHVSETFESQVALFLPEGPDDSLNTLRYGEGVKRLDKIDEGVAYWVFKHRQAAGMNTDTLPGAAAMYVPLLSPSRVIGVLAIRPQSPSRLLAPEQIHLLETFANQMAVALERAELSVENEKNRLQVKAEQLRNSLLSSVSHDLRTPLATITGAATSIIEGSESLRVQDCKDMAREIYGESARLNRLVGNLLDMTRVQSGNLPVKKEWCPVDEIIGAALSYLDNQLVGRRVKIDIADDMPAVQVDSILIQQVLVNLLENAVKYTPAGSTIEVSAFVSPCQSDSGRDLDRDSDLALRPEAENPSENSSGDRAVFSVADQGPGVSEEMRRRIFEKFVRNDTSQPGFGLGLAICAGIVEAHGGTIKVENRPQGGAVFSFSLPMDGVMPELETIEN